MITTLFCPSWSPSSLAMPKREETVFGAQALRHGESCYNFLKRINLQRRRSFEFEVVRIVHHPFESGLRNLALTLTIDWHTWHLLCRPDFFLKGWVNITLASQCILARESCNLLERNESCRALDQTAALKKKKNASCLHLILWSLNVSRSREYRA